MTEAARIGGRLWEAAKPRLKKLGRGLAWAGIVSACLTVWLWCFGALLYSNLPWAFARGLMAVAFLVSVPAALILRVDRHRVAKWVGGTAALIAIWQMAIRPSNDREWTSDQEALATAEISGDLVTVRNIRNCVYRSEEDYDVRHYDATFDLNELESVWYGVEPFGGFEGAAHTFLSFGFKGDRYLAVSVEIRKERGETFSVFKGLFKQFELMYVIGDERDIVLLRSNIRKNPVYLYPAKSNEAGRRKLFLSVMNRANGLAGKPEFYDTLLSNCTTAIADHVNELIPGKVPWGRRVILPGYSGELAHELGLLDTDLSFEEA
ncbi:MAG: hypothetical protein ACI9VS_000108 [Candidatus Binatia bacterium]|jgi:hypothetical protein